MFHRSESVCVAALVALGMSAGCTLVYDGDSFARVDAAADIDPAALALDSVEPATLFEGLGADESSRAIPILIHGSNIAAGARIEITGGGIELDVVAQTSRDGSMAATAVRVPVDTALAAGSSAMASITLRQGDGATDSLDLGIEGLDELTPAGGTLSTDNLASRYSRIRITEAISLVGDSPARFVATDSLEVSSELRADGRGDGQRSAGGELGGLPEQNGDGAGGGTRGVNTAGGGGGGNLEKGGDGQGAGAGSGGAPVDAAFLFPLVQAVGHGGGGGGGAALQAGAGGSGGGAIELRADGPLTLSAGASLSANGFPGGSTSNCSLDGGGGGGGSGGALLIRSASQLTIGTGVSFSVEGGLGGSASAIGSCKGGDGAPGRVRADFPEAQGSASNAVRGPSWLPDSVPAVVSSAQLLASITGEVGATYVVTVNNENPAMLTLTEDTADVALTLAPGLNQVCALVDPDGNQGQPESLNCLSIAYLP